MKYSPISDNLVMEAESDENSENFLGNPERITAVSDKSPIQLGISFAI